MYDNTVYLIEELLKSGSLKEVDKELYLIVDRVVVQDKANNCIRSCSDVLGIVKFVD